MKKNLYSAPDPFSMSPMLRLLPVKGSVHDLKNLTTSLYARYENVQALKVGGNLSDRENQLKLLSLEESMLKNILDWLSTVA